MKAAIANFPEEKENTGLDSPSDVKFTLLIRSSYAICGAHCKIKMQDLLFKNYQEFQDSTALNEAQGPVLMPRSQVHEAGLSLRKTPEKGPDEGKKRQHKM